MNGLTSTLPHPPWRWRENILQLLPDAVVPSKDELAAYWHTVAQKALRYLARRPLKLVRHTRGTTFYHKSRLLPVPIASISCASRSAKAATACASGFTERRVSTGSWRWASSKRILGRDRRRHPACRSGGVSSTETQSKEISSQA